MFLCVILVLLNYITMKLNEIIHHFPGQRWIFLEVYNFGWHNWKFLVAVRLYFTYKIKTVYRLHSFSIHTATDHSQFYSLSHDQYFIKKNVYTNVGILFLKDRFYSQNDFSKQIEWLKYTNIIIHNLRTFPSRGGNQLIMRGVLGKILIQIFWFMFFLKINIMILKMGEKFWSFQITLIQT